MIELSKLHNLLGRPLSLKLEFGTDKGMTTWGPLWSQIGPCQLVANADNTGFDELRIHALTTLIVKLDPALPLSCYVFNNRYPAAAVIKSTDPAMIISESVPEFCRRYLRHAQLPTMRNLQRKYWAISNGQIEFGVTVAAIEDGTPVDDDEAEPLPAIEDARMSNETAACGLSSSSTQPIHALPAPPVMLAVADSQQSSQLTFAGGSDIDLGDI